MSTMTQLGHIDLQCCVADAWKVFIDGLENRSRCWMPI